MTWTTHLRTNNVLGPTASVRDLHDFATFLALPDDKGIEDLADEITTVETPFAPPSYGWLWPDGRTIYRNTAGLGLKALIVTYAAGDGPLADEDDTYPGTIEVSIDTPYGAMAVDFHLKLASWIIKFGKMHGIEESSWRMTAGEVTSEWETVERYTELVGLS